MNKLKIVVILIVSLSLLGCTPSLKITNKDSAQISVDEGFVFGSIQIKLVDDPDGKRPFLKMSLANTKWQFLVNNVETSSIAKFFNQEQFKLTATADGEETPFLAKLPAGKYLFDDVYKNGFASWRGHAGKYFVVESGKTTYIGRLVVKMPKFGGQLLGVRYTVEDAFADTLAVLEESHGDLDGVFRTRLMKSYHGEQEIETYDKDPSIKRVIAQLFSRLGKDAFIIYDHWGHDRMAIGINSTQYFGVLIYISTFETPANHYDVRLELPPTKGSDFPYSEAGKYDSVDFEDLVLIIKKHLNLKI